jgi:hypothetical protein
VQRAEAVHGRAGQYLGTRPAHRVQPADLDEVVSLPGRPFARQVQARAEDATDTDGEELAAANLPG